jgi:ABC-type branched-subunit amino acid transport system substrate-binding protein
MAQNFLARQSPIDRENGAGYRAVSPLWIAALLMSAAFAGPLSAPEKIGREIYRRGAVAGKQAGTARVGSESVPITTASFACANCHGIWGEGGRESGIDVPRLDWGRLSSPAISPVTGRRRAGYTPASLRRAITAGVDPSGTRFYAAMPRFAFPAASLDALVAYLARIGDDGDLDPGVTSSAIRVGAALPLTGPMEGAGQAIRRTLEAMFAAADRDGGIYGRKIELVVEDSSRSDAVNRLMAGGVLALVANLGADSASALLERDEIPLIGPVAISPHPEGVPNRYIFYLLSDYFDQARALVDFVAAREAPNRPRFAALYSGSKLNLDAVAGLRAQTTSRGFPLVASERMGDPGALAAILARNPDYLLFCGAGDEIAPVVRELQQAVRRPVLLAFQPAAQSPLAALGGPVAESALLAAPAFPPDNAGAPEFFSILNQDPSAQQYIGFRAAAFAAGSVLLEALRANGQRISRESLIRVLEHQSFPTGVTVPLHFSPNRRVGSSGALILALDARSGEFRPVSNWITPKDAP